MDGTEEQLWRDAADNLAFRFRWFGDSVAIESVDQELELRSEWASLRKRIVEGDRICPFQMNAKTSAMRCGYVVLRGTEPIGGVVTLVS
ncbi:MAG: hypothetical protein AAFX06_10405 [Planctomycetota bacterium]